MRSKLNTKKKITFSTRVISTVKHKTNKKKNGLNHKNQNGHSNETFIIHTHQRGTQTSARTIGSRNTVVFNKKSRIFLTILIFVEKPENFFDYSCRRRVP